METHKLKYFRYLFFISISVCLGLIRYLFYDTSNNVWNEGEEFTDLNGNGLWDQGEEFIDENNFKLFSKFRDITTFSTSIIDKVNKKKLFYNSETSISNYVEYKEAKFFNDNDLAVFVDSRDAQEINLSKQGSFSGRIPNSIVIPLSDIETIDNQTEYFYTDLSENNYDLLTMDFENEMQTISILETLPKDIPYIIYCGYELCDKSSSLAEYMVNYFNFEKIGVYKQGWEEWYRNHSDK
tara:strand:- start:2114 stop:2830 length:717 start_codon:yes stop_codon:yes gene_type:complete